MEQETQEQTNKFNNKIYYILPEFSGKNVPIIEVAKLMGHRRCFCSIWFFHSQTKKEAPIIRFDLNLLQRRPAGNIR